MSEASVYIKRDLQLSSEDDDWWLGISKLFSLFGLALAGSTANRLPSCIKVVLATTILFVGSLFMIFGPGFFYLLLGRLTINVGAGYTLTIAFVYITEISPTFYCGLLTSFPELVKTMFTLVCAISIDRMGWRRLMLISVGGMILSLVSLGVSLTIIHHHEKVEWVDAICVFSLLC
ncbi:putative polyol transporter 1 [Eucalyptus grandis]|uniref:putative polyol transporter 1 n=1 Tax=Eucalyptus grandis TaxID=71139 RepID=UPI00192EAE59|nr:putative polyol transporter 1 [Eucalyptus grandis]